MKAGFGRLDITPPFGSPLDGYYEKRSMDSIKDNLYLNAIALNDGDNTVILISADLIGISISDCRYIQKISFFTQYISIPLSDFSIRMTDITSAMPMPRCSTASSATWHSLPWRI